MRTRFLDIDYFSSPSSTSFFNLPIPHLPSPSGVPTERLPGFDFPPIIDAPPEIDNLRTEPALAKLLADVLPQTIDVQGESFEPAVLSDGRDFGNGNVENEAEIMHEDKEAAEIRSNYEIACPEDGLSRSESKGRVINRSKELVELIEFEVPELDIHLEDPHILEKGFTDIFAGVPLIKNDEDKLDQGFIMYNHRETIESIYSLADIELENLIEMQDDLVVDETSVQVPAKFHFPLLEVDDVSLATLMSISIEDELADLLGKIEDQLLSQYEGLTVADQHSLKFMEHALLEPPSYDCPSNMCTEADLASAEIFLEIDFINIAQTSCNEVNLSSCQGAQDGNHYLLFSPVVLEELQLLDKDRAPLLEVFDSSTFHQPDLWEEISEDGLICKSFDELVVSHELALTDDMFKPLPIPLLSDCQEMKLLLEITEKVFLGSELQPRSASDDIYLDWHLLEDENRNSAVCSCFQDMIVAIDIHSIDFDWRTAGILEVVLDFVMCDYGSDGPVAEECDKSPEMLYSRGSVLNEHVETASSESLDGHQSQANQTLLSEENVKRASSVFNSMSSFNDLDFFLNPSKAGTEKGNAQASRNSNGMINKIQSNSSEAAYESVNRQMQQEDVILHQVYLSDDLIAITENLKRSYLSILKSNVELKRLHSSFQVADEFSLLSVSKLVFMDCIKNLGIRKPALPSQGEPVVTCATLCAIKQITWYLCYYGIHIARSYLDKLCEGLDCFASRLQVLQCFLVDKDKKADVEKVNSHPSLFVIQNILLSSTIKNALKALVVADKLFLSELKMLLTSLGISFSELNECTRYPGSDLYDHGPFSIEKMGLLLAKDCLLASPENISADFPVNKFEIILEYGGSCGSSRITTLFSKLSRLPCHHFLKVEVDKSTAARALCEGVSTAQQMVMATAGESQFVKYAEEYIDLSNLEALLNFVPLAAKIGNSDKKESRAVPPVPCEPFSAEPKDIQMGIMPFPELVIIMNTQSSEKEMIVSRRSTYQKILALEKMGAQVIERDSNLPADIIISPAACLVWYECSTLLKNGTGSHDASSWLPCHVENIATNILSFLSLSFSCCILIFEGENGFLTTVMESSDGLYAAAASLGIDLQLFCSYSAELTDEIILSCINNGTRFINGLFPKLPETETLAESFLSKFPSINPLIAHSIVSSGGMLADFLEWSHGSRINALQKYHVSEESISLFSALCRYGEREDSQSIMTDSSSSVSSVPDSKYRLGDLGSRNKRCKYMRDPHNNGMPEDDLVQPGSAKQSVDYTLKFPEIRNDNSWESNKVKISDPRGCESSLKDFLVDEEGIDPMVRIFRPRVTDPRDCNLPRGALLPTLSEKHSSDWNIASVGPNLGMNEATVSGMEWLSSRNSEAMKEEVRGEVIDLKDPAIFNPIDFSFLEQDLDGGPVKKPEYSSAQGNRRTFPTVAEMEASSYCTSPTKHQNYSPMRGVDEFLSQDHNNDSLHLKYLRTLPNADLDGRSSRSAPSMTAQGERSNYRGTPLRKALHSSHLQRESPWTMEFLNGIREKSNSRLQALPPETSPCPSIRRNTPNRIKRRSPSILEFFKYQGGSTVRKIPEQKRQKTSSQPLGSFKNDKALPIALSRTPADKRARRMLSYATNETGSQTRLVWSERNLVIECKASESKLKWRGERKPQL